jgi:hypothetical protein
MNIDMKPGFSAKGLVPFDVPPGTKPAAVELRDSAFSGGATVQPKVPLSPGSCCGQHAVPVATTPWLALSVQTTLPRDPVKWGVTGAELRLPPAEPQGSVASTSMGIEPVSDGLLRDLTHRRASSQDSLGSTSAGRTERPYDSGVSASG